MTTPTPYTPLYWDDLNALPAPTGLYGKEIFAEKTPEVQRLETAKMLQFITSATPEQYATLITSKMPMALLIKVPDTHMVRFITGLAPFMQDPFSAAPASSLEGNFLSIMQDIDSPTEAPIPLELPLDVIKINAVMAPTQTQFSEKIARNDDATTGLPWFTQNAVKDTTVQVPTAVPFPPYLAYDAFTQDVPAHELWERVQCAEQEGMEAVFEMAKNFFAAVHVSHNASNKKTVAIPGYFFFKRPPPEAKQWAAEQAARIYTTVQAQKDTAQQLVTTPPRTTDLSVLVQALTNANPSIAPLTSPTSVVDEVETAIFKKYGLGEADMARVLTMCGLRNGQEDMLPDWFEKVSSKQLSKEGKHVLLRQLMTTDLRFEEHRIPLTPTLLKMIVDKAFGGDEDSETASGAMKGLSPYTMAAMTAEEVASEHDYSTAMSLALATTLAEVKKLTSKKASAPKSVQALMVILRTFTNVLEKLFGPRGYLYKGLVADVIKPLANMSPLAKTLMAPHTIASIMWAVFKQTRRYTMGLMADNAALVPEWVIMVSNLRGAQDFRLLEVPVDIAGNIAVIELDQAPTKASNKRSTPEGGQKLPQSKLPKKEVFVHPAIKAKLTQAFPDRLDLRKLCSICNVRDVRHLFPDTSLCAFAMLKGFCPYRQCTNDHDGHKVTDKMAEAVIDSLGPFIRNPQLLSQG